MSNNQNKMDNKTDSKTVSEDLSQFDWIQLRQDLGEIKYGETMLEKLKRKTKENPFVPLGCAATTMALGYGLYSFRKGRQRMSQNMMRTRVVAQGLTIVAIILGVAIGAK